MRRLTGSLAAAALVLTAGLAQAPPASATVHEIVGQWCAGRGELLPPGLTGGSRADNFAKPLFASGFASAAPYLDGILVSFDFDNPNSKLVGTGEIVQIGPGLYVTGFMLDPGFGAFQHCPRLHTP
jgi:hypothetical protein